MGTAGPRRGVARKGKQSTFSRKPPAQRSKQAPYRRPRTDAAVSTDSPKKQQHKSNKMAGPRRVSTDKTYSHVKNKEKRQQLVTMQNRLKRAEAKQRKEEREKAGVTIEPQTIEKKREFDETIVKDEDVEIEKEEEFDEFANYYVHNQASKILITSCRKPSKKMLMFMADCLYTFPNSYYYKRKKFQLKQIIEYAKEEQFTDVMVFTQHAKKPCAMILCHLPDGPTATFRVSGVKLREELDKHTSPSGSNPELIMNNFNTRLGHRMTRMFGALFPHTPEFDGRRVITFHNQRDFIFVRQHRYIFEDPDDPKKQRAYLAEIGPRFTLRLLHLQLGTFDTKFGEYEWFHKKFMDTSRHRFHL